MYHPIIFTDESIQAILAGCKTQTRRVMTSMRGLGEIGWPVPVHDNDGYEIRATLWRGVCNTADIVSRCPYGERGDLLWVREAWLPNAPSDMADGFYSYDGVLLDTIPPKYRRPKYCLYRADKPRDLKWRPSMFMPRWASRITLEIVSVRFERITDISPMDCEAEGAGNFIDFKETWDKINARRGYGWDIAPWVWAIEFRVQQVTR